MRAAANCLTAASSRPTPSYASSPTPIKFRYICFLPSSPTPVKFRCRFMCVCACIHTHTHTHTHTHAYVCIQVYDNNNVYTFVCIHVCDNNNGYTYMYVILVMCTHFVYIHAHDNTNVYALCNRCSTCETKSKARDGRGTCTILRLSSCR